MNRSTLNILIPLIIAGLVGTYFYSQSHGQKSGELIKARLELVWPTFTTLPGVDRALMGGFAVSCHLDDKPAEAPAVIACLREAATKSDAIRPQGMEQAQASARLETLIDQAQGK
ncbi:hypothetical protein [Pseudomonas sp. dw_358]|uniref:hypothetical protein n=1 Tax=Pseudomonas sp. dw_358 TaxID=2720083 RepID=UPI001BD43B54|nr:hypothetical protein [Pseudomonas sp. dw_358]